MQIILKKTLSHELYAKESRLKGEGRPLDGKRKSNSVRMISDVVKANKFREQL
jgi:hypothetical protein